MDLDREKRSLKRASEFLRKASKFFAPAELGGRLKWWSTSSTSAEANTESRCHRNQSSPGMDAVLMQPSFWESWRGSRNELFPFLTGIVGP
jgi:hypothetical protein